MNNYAAGFNFTNNEWMHDDRINHFVFTAQQHVRNIQQLRNDIQQAATRFAEFDATRGYFEDEAMGILQNMQRDNHRAAEKMYGLKTINQCISTMLSHDATATEEEKITAYGRYLEIIDARSVFGDAAVESALADFGNRYRSAVSS